MYNIKFGVKSNRLVLITELYVSLSWEYKQGEVTSQWYDLHVVGHDVVVVGLLRKANWLKWIFVSLFK